MSLGVGFASTASLAPVTGIDVIVAHAALTICKLHVGKLPIGRTSAQRQPESLTLVSKGHALRNFDVEVFR